MSGIGLTGTHRTGKTTLARALSESKDVPFVQGVVSKVYEELGLDPALDYPFEVRLTVQERILSAHVALYELEDGVFVTDRTPVDFMAYTLADVHRETLTPEQDARLQKYLKSCINATNRFFSVLIIVQPGIPVVHAAGKGSMCKSYMDKIAHLIMGIVVNEDIHAQHFQIPKRIIDLDRRVNAVTNSVVRHVAKHQRMIESAVESGEPIVFH